MFGVTLRTFNDLRPSYNDNAITNHAAAAGCHLIIAVFGGGDQLTLLKYNAGLADPQIQAKGDTLYVTGEQVKYRDPREGSSVRSDRDERSAGWDKNAIRITENRLNMPQVTTETDVASLKNHLAGEPLLDIATKRSWRAASSQWFRSPPSRAGISTNHALISISIRC